MGADFAMNPPTPRPDEVKALKEEIKTLRLKLSRAKWEVTNLRARVQKAKDGRPVTGSYSASGRVGLSK